MKMEEKIIHQLNEKEAEEIANLYEKRLALENLIKILDGDNEKIYNKVIEDYTNTTREFQKWWDNMSTKYQWQGSNWLINFETKTVVLID